MVQNFRILTTGPVQTGLVSLVFFGFLFHGIVELQLKVWFFSGPVQSQSSFFPVLWTGLLIPRIWDVGLKY